MTHTNTPSATSTDIVTECKNCLESLHSMRNVGEPVFDDHNVAFCSLSCEDDYKEAAHPTPTRKVRKCGICRTPGHDRRKCPTLDTVVAPVGFTPTYPPLTPAHTSPPCGQCGETNYLYTNVLLCDTCLEIPGNYLHAAKCERRRVACLPVYNHPALRYTVGCTITSPDNSTQDATPELFADILLQCRDMWGDDAPVITGMRKSYLTPDDARCAMGSISAYTSETCPTCKAVYSGADIVAHIRTHGHIDRTVGYYDTLADKSDTAAYVAKYATRARGTYMSESEGLSDTTELTDAHVRECDSSVGRAHLSVDVLVKPTRKCKVAQCMQKCDDSALVYKHGIEGGSSYSCVHGTQWNEVWETSYTHARWDHLRDSHLQEQTYSDNAGHFGQNPLFVYLWRQKHTRTQRMRHLTTWVANVGMSKLLHTKKSDVLKTRRNLTVAQAVGFATTPVGKWDGVSGSDICGLVRDTPLTLTYIVGQGPLKGHTVPVATTCRRMAEWSGIYLTKEDLAYVNLLISRRLTGKAVAHIVAKSGTPPTSRRKSLHPLTKGDSLRRFRIYNYNVREDARKWETSDSVYDIGVKPTRMPEYVPHAECVHLATLGYTPAF
jgi:hypothetical protein